MAPSVGWWCLASLFIPVELQYFSVFDWNLYWPCWMGAHLDQLWCGPGLVYPFSNHKNQGMLLLGTWCWFLIFYTTSKTTNSIQSGLVSSIRNGLSRWQFEQSVLSSFRTITFNKNFVKCFGSDDLGRLVLRTCLVTSRTTTSSQCILCFCISQILWDWKYVEVGVLPRPLCGALMGIALEDWEYDREGLLVTAAE